MSNLPTVLPIEGLQYHFQPSKQHTQYLNFVGKPKAHDLLHPSPADDTLWKTFTTTEKTELMKTVVRTIVLRAHTGITVLDNKVIHEAVKSKVVLSDAKKFRLSSKAMIYYSQPLLQSLFGYEVVMGVDYDPEGKNLEELQTTVYIVRLHIHCAGNDGSERKNKPTPALSAHSAELMMGTQRERPAAKRGLLMTILSLILNSKELEISEQSLHRYLKEIDPTLPGSIEGTGTTLEGSRSKSATKSKGKDKDDDDDDTVNERHILYDWKTIIRDDFTKNNYLEYDSLTTNDNDNNNTNATDPANQIRGYRIGIASRVLVGMIGVYEYNTSLKGKSATSRTLTDPEIITQDTVGLLLKRELGHYRDKLPESRLQAVEREVIGIYDEEEENDEDNQRSTNEDDADTDEHERRGGRKQKKKRNNDDSDDEDSTGDKRSRRR